VAQGEDTFGCCTLCEVGLSVCASAGTRLLTPFTSVLYNMAFNRGDAVGDATRTAVRAALRTETDEQQVYKSQDEGLSFDLGGSGGVGFMCGLGIRIRYCADW